MKSELYCVELIRTRQSPLNTWTKLSTWELHSYSELNSEIIASSTSECIAREAPHEKTCFKSESIGHFAFLFIWPPSKNSKNQNIA